MELSLPVLVGAILAAITYAITSVLFIIARAEKAKGDALIEVAKNKAEIEKVAERINGAKEKFESELKAQAEAEAKRRHDLANQMQQTSSSISAQHRTDIKEINDRLDRMARETVRKEDMNHLEARMTTVLEKLEGKIDAGMVRLEQKIDTLRNPLSGSTHSRQGN